MACLVMVSAWGCAPTLSFVSYEPGQIEPRGARRFVIVDGEGKRRAREQVSDILADELHGGWYEVKDRSDDHIKLVLAGKRATVVPESAGRIADGDLWLRADVVGWRIGPAVEESRGDDGTIVLRPLLRAEVALQMTVADSEGNVLMREQEFAGMADAPVSPALIELDLLGAAARQAVRQFVASVEPRRISWRLKLDDSDKSQEAILEGIRDGALVSARRALERKVKQQPKNAAAHYNLAVTLDAQGASAKALEHYDAAIELGARDFYFAARDGAARRAAALEALYGAPPPKKKRAPRPDDDDEGDGKQGPAGAAPPVP